MKCVREDTDSVQVFGAGNIGKTVTFLLMNQGVIVKCILDNDEKRHGRKIWGNVNCIFPAEGNVEIPVIIAIEKKSIVDEVQKQLSQLGYNCVLAVDIDELEQEVSRLPDSEFLKLKHYCVHERILNLDSPVTLNEKLQWLKIHDRNPLYATLGDKYKVREYLAEKFGEEYLIPLLFMTYDYHDISEDKVLLENCAIKTNCWSGDVEFFRSRANNSDYVRLQKKFEKIFNSNWSERAREWWYSRMVPCVLVEELLTTKDGKLPNDYKLHFFNGKLEFIYCSIDREGENYRKIYSNEWKELPFSWNGSATPPEKDDFNGRGYCKRYSLCSGRLL